MSRLQQQWYDYIEYENHGLRTQAIESLEQFLEMMAKESVDFQNRWAMSLASRIVDEGLSFKVRLPLFRQLLFPALLRGILEGEFGAARWLADFDQLLYHSGDCLNQLPESLRTRYALLNEELRRNSADVKALQGMIEIAAWQLNYAIHELPTGVLYGHSGANVDQCLDLIADLNDFEQLIGKAGMNEKYSELCAECRFHFTEYGKYLTDRRKYHHYRDFLAKREN